MELQSVGQGNRKAHRLASRELLFMTETSMETGQRNLSLSFGMSDNHDRCLKLVQHSFSSGNHISSKLDQGHLILQMNMLIKIEIC